MHVYGSKESGRPQSCLCGQGRPVRAWQKAQGAAEQGKGWTIGPQGVNDKGLGISLSDRRLKGKLVTVSLQRNEF